MLAVRAATSYTARMPGFATPNPFLKAECDRLGLGNWGSNITETYGQENEDLILEALLRSLLLRSGRGMDHVRYVEIGANHPVQHSNTYLFYRKYGARGVLVEPIADLCRVLAETRPGDTVVNCAVSGQTDKSLTFFVTKHAALSSLSPDHMKQFDEGGEIVEELTVDNLHINDFMGQYYGDGVDYLCVDTEGLDTTIIVNLDLNKFRPSFIQCELERQFEAAYFHLATHGYSFIAATETNFIFMDNAAALTPGR
jgi:FkbM family methyltransferase